MPCRISTCSPWCRRWPRFTSTPSGASGALDLFIDPAVAPRLLPGYSRTRQRLKAVCLVGAVALLVVALTEPQWGKSLQDVPRRGRDLMVVLDVSLSMLAEDATPNRLQRAKAAI